jgi:hypothetical protein
MSDNGPSGGNFDNWALPPQPPAWPSQQPSTPPKRTSSLFTLGAAIAATVLIGAVGGVAVAFLTRPASVTNPGGGSPTPIPTTPADPGAVAAAQALYQKALATIAAASGFHYTLTSTGASAESFVGDADPAGGRQTITLTTPYGGEQFNLVLVSGTVYFQGNVPALEDQLGVPAAKAPALVNKWISLVKGNGPYSTAEVGITPASIATIPAADPEDSDIYMVPAASGPAVTASGTAVTRIRGTIPAVNGALGATAFLDVLPNSNIPVDYQSVLSGGGVTETTSMIFSQWGTAVAVTAPSGAVAWSTLGASAPSGGYGMGTGPSSGPTPTPAGPTPTPKAI